MSVTENGWGEVERRARQHEQFALDQISKAIGVELKITVEDRQRGAIVAAMGELEQGNASAAWQILQASLKIRGEL